MQTFRKMTVLIISLILSAGFITTSLVSYLVSLDTMKQQISERELPLTSDNIYSEIQRDLLQPIFISSLMANDTFLRDWVTGGEVDEDKIIRYLKGISEKYDTFTSFFVSENTRNYYQTSGILKTVRETDDRDKWFFRVRKMSNDFEINVDPDMAHLDTMTIFVNYKVYDDDGSFIGATGVGLSVSAVKKLISRYQKDYNRRIFFTDSSGKIVLFDSESGLSETDISAIHGYADLKTRILANLTASLSYRNKGVVHFVNTRLIPEFSWYLIVEESTAIPAGVILRAFFINIGICLFITLIVVVISSIVLGSYQKQIERLATTDSLTGLYNRRGFDMLYPFTVQDAQRNASDFAAILMDIDLFKEVNDAYGHLTGDAVLENLARVLKSAIRQSDLLFRWGGEEFLIIAKNCTDASAEVLAENIRSKIETTVTRYKEYSISRTISLGITTWQQGEDVSTLLSRADQALYEAKQAGRNCVRLR